jgi:hypothetical protein
MTALLFAALLSSTSAAARPTSSARSDSSARQPAPAAPFAVEAAPVETRTGWHLEVSWMPGSTDVSHHEVWRWRTDTGWQLAGRTRRTDNDFIDTAEEIEVVSASESWEGYTIWKTDAPVYRIRAISRWGSATSESAWATNRIPGFRLNLLPIYGSTWNNPYMVAESWEDAESNLAASIEEVALTGGNVMPAWNWTAETIESSKSQKLIAMFAETRAIAEEANVPIRIIAQTRPDVYAESEYASPGFDDSWLSWVSRAETCETLMAMTDQGFTVQFVTGTKNTPDFWSRVWGAPLIDGDGHLLFDPETCGPDAVDLYGSTAPLFYGAVRAESQTVTVHAVLTDLTQPDYIEWSTDWAATTIEGMGADVAFTPVKSAWHAWSDLKSPNVLAEAGLTADDAWSCQSWQPSRMDDWELATNGTAPLSACSPYGPGEFEMGMRHWARRFSSKAPGVPLMTNENPAMGDMPGKLSWTNDEPWLEDLILGEMYFIDPCEVYSQCYDPVPAE